MEENDYPIIPAEREDDLHNPECADSADLTIFMAGNQFMAMEKLISAFQKENPEVANIYYQTLPPGLELRQILAGGAWFKDRFLPCCADIYTSVNEKSMKTLEKRKFIEPGGYRLYLKNRLSIMVPKGNPAGISRVTDLSRDDVRISQPDPRFEDIAHHIMNMYRDAGGNDLVHRIMEEKRAEATTILTVVHHRETPLRISKKTVDAGPLWATEINHAEKKGLSFDVVEPGKDLDQRDSIHYYICCLKNGPRPENGEKFIRFIVSEKAQEIYREFGFLPFSE